MIDSPDQDLDIDKALSAIIVEGNFDEFYQKNFRDQLEADLLSDPNNDGGFLNPADAKRMKVSNWKKSVKI